jgi:hypothetical protein
MQMFSIQTRHALRAALTIAGATALAVVVAAHSAPVDYKPSVASLHLSEAMATRVDRGAWHVGLEGNREETKR